MDYLTVKEVAELKGCSERFIRKLINNGDLSSEEVVNRANGHKSHSIPISALPDELQQRYYKQQRSDAGLLPEVKEKEKPAARKHRNRMSFWQRWSSSRRSAA